MFARAINPILRVNGENGFASDGTLEERYEYTPYGERTVYMRAGSADEKTSAPLYESQRVEVASVRQPYGLCDFGHQGLALDKEFGQYYNRSRQFLFRSARFLNRDPAGYANGMSLYEYCASGPLGATDPMGLCRDPNQPGPADEDDGSKTAKDSPEQIIDDFENGKISGAEALKRARGLSKEEQAELARRLQEKYPQSGGVDTRNRSSGESQYNSKTGLKDYGNPRAEDAPSYADLAVAAAKEARARFAEAAGQALNRAVDLAEGTLRAGSAAARYSMDIGAYEGEVVWWAGQYRTPAAYAATLAGPAVGAAPLPPARQAEEPVETLTLMTTGT